MLKTIVDILNDNSELLTSPEQKALRQRLVQRGNTQQALDEEMDRIHGAYNQTNAYVISLLVRIEQLENLLSENKIPIPEGPDFTLARARIATENRRTLYPELLHALRLAGDRIERDEEERQYHIRETSLVERLVATLERTVEIQGDSLTRARQRSDKAEAQIEPSAPPQLDPTLCRAENEKRVPEAKLRAARAILSDDICPDEEVREQAIYLIWHNEDNRTLYENTIRPLRRDQRMHFAKLPVRQQARLCELLLHRRDRDGFSQATLQALFEVEP